MPAIRAADPGRVGRHGMEIVRAVTEELFGEQELVSKRIAARIALGAAFSPRNSPFGLIRPSALWGRCFVRSGRKSAGEGGVHY
ncbi:hypothetical protein [Streptomyces sp. NPDC055607]